MTTTDPTVSDVERADDPNDPLTRRLEKVGSIIKRGNARLDRITANFINPPEPDKPGVRDALNDIKTAANDAIAKADALLGRLGGV